MDKPIIDVDEMSKFIEKLTGVETSVDKQGEVVFPDELEPDHTIVDKEDGFEVGIDHLPEHFYSSSKLHSRKRLRNGMSENISILLSLTDDINKQYENVCNIFRKNGKENIANEMKMFFRKGSNDLRWSVNLAIKMGGRTAKRLPLRHSPYSSEGIAYMAGVFHASQKLIEENQSKADIIKYLVMQARGDI